MTQPLFTYFLNSIWQVPILALCAWLALRISRPTPRSQYALWIATLLLALVLPLRGISLAPQPTVSVSTADFDGPLPPLPTPRAHLPFLQIAVSPRTAGLLAALYLALTGLCLIRLLLAQIAVRRLLAASTPWRPPLSSHTIRTLPPTHSTPLVAGVLHPTILLPASLHLAPPHHLAAVLAHESAHIRRRDLLANLSLRILTIPIAWHPAAAYLHRQIRRTRELLVDALAARTLASSTAYASSLLALAGELIHPTTPLTQSLFDHPSQQTLEERIMHLVAPPVPPSRLVRATRIAVSVLVLSTAALTASLIHITPSVLAAQQPATPAAQLAPAIALDPLSSVPPAPLVLPPAQVHQLTPQQRKLFAEQAHAAARQSRQAIAQFNLPEVQKQIAEAARSPIDPATQARLNQLSAEISKSAVNSPEFKKAMEDLHRQLDSPEFKQHVRDLTAQVQQQIPSAEAIRKMTEDVQRQVNSPEFRQQLAQIRTDTAAIQKQAAEAAAAAQFAPSITPSGQETPVHIAAGIMAGQRESGKNPTYPPDAKAARIQGAVILHAVIARDGTIEALQVVSGPPELQQSALDAVKTWVYKPYLLNGQPTAVDTTITVTYSLAN